MNRGHFTINKETGELIPVEKSKPKQVTTVIEDTIPGGLESMVDGKIYDSKSALRAHYKRAGVIEKGNDHVYLKKEHWSETEEYQRKLQEDSERAWYEVRDGMAPLTELDREQCKIIDHNMEHYNYDRRKLDRNGNPRE